MSGAGGSCRKDASKAFDHTALVHSIWTHCMKHRVQLWVERAPSAENISDLPSRHQYQLLSDLGAVPLPLKIGLEFYRLEMGL